MNLCKKAAWKTIYLEGAQLFSHFHGTYG
uniref:Uncharacterized protein n=1 Tax=Rhizophora mucronata TaxID=61149 RepID=A0A2P2PAN3_RHIMU